MKKIYAFVDDKLERGHEIWPSLVQAIKQSFISLVIFSQDYACSRWCFEELVTILECKEKYGRIVVPIFYHLKPTHVRHQSLESYKNAFAEHERNYENKVQMWRQALRESAGFSGIESSKFQNDAELLKEIVNLVLTKLAEPMFRSKGLVGIDEKIADVESLIRKSKESKDICLIGIWGMGGVGKTTLAEEIFNKLQSEYEGYYFLANEREQSSKRGIISLKNEIFSALLTNVVRISTQNSLPDDIVRRIGRMKVFIVLDNVNDSDHLQNLLGALDNFGSGSRIIVTTRDEQVLNANKADEIYRLREFSFDKALELFNLIVFNQSDHQREDAKGIPLVLKVLAHRLRGKNKEVWESELNKLKKMPPTKVYDVMKLSYDDLDRKEQRIFLDLACFVLRLHRKVNVGNLRSLLKDEESDNSVVVGLERLKDKALITFSKLNFICMHDSLQEMGWEIVRRESNKDPRSCSWLWDPDDICEALKNDKGIESIRSMQIDLTKIKEQKLSHHIFAKMSRLQFLEIYNGSYRHSILAEVILKLPFSKMKKLWDGVKNLVNLKELDLNSSEELKKLPDLSKAINLEVLILWGCSRLTKVHPSIFTLGKLEKLDLWNCKSFTILASDSHLCSLNYLNLDLCINLIEFSLISKNMTELRLEDTKIRVLPSSFGHQRKLKSLHLAGSSIVRLPSSFNNLTQLLHLDVYYCTKLQTIAELPLSLETLDAQACYSLQSLPDLPPSLKTLNLKSCTLLQSLPKFPPSLVTLNVQSCISLQTISKLPSSLKTLKAGFCESLKSLPELSPSLEILNVESCKLLQSLPWLPLSLETLHAQHCDSLQTITELPLFLKTLDVRYCASLQSLPELPLFLTNLEANNCGSLLSVQEFPVFLETLEVRFCESLQSLPEVPLFLKVLNVESCKSLQSLPRLPPSLETLCARCCHSLQTLPELPSSLETLNVQECKSLQSLPELPLSLKILEAQFCYLLQTLPELPPCLETLNVTECKSLKTALLFPSTAVEQLRETRTRVLFLNCLNLDEHSLVAIGLNVQINMMKFANQHLL
uniref:TMV resistance protein N n=1 Tax=Cajanus cajan TaxID=3821 RepID=A0A151RCT6_CAJCA|nr:TMV resistance protein N [Cajanus cajan]